MSTGILLLGCTHPHSPLHLGTLRASDQVTGIRFWDPDVDAAESLAEQAGGKAVGVTADLREALSGPEPFALVCRTNDRTPETALAAFAAGKHVLSEKPGARSSAELVPVVEAARRARVGLGYCYPWRSHPAAIDLRGDVERGRLGRLLAVEARLVTSQVRFRDPAHWLFTRELGGGGILHWLACHFIDLLRFILVDEVVRVTALTGTLNGFPLQVEDTAALAVEWGSGALGTFSAGYHLPRSVAGYSGATYDNMLAARGLDGRFTWHPTRDKEIVRLESIHPEWAGAPERERRYRLEPSPAYSGRHGLAFFHEFLARARAGTRQLASGEDALATLRIVEAAYRSAESGRVESVMS